MWGKTIKGRGYVKFPWGSPWTMMLWKRMHAVRYLVCAGLDYWIMLQDGRNPFPWHGSLNQWVHKMRHCCGWGGWSMRKLEPIARLSIRRANMVKRGLMYSKQKWKWMLISLWKNENIGSYVGYYEELNWGFCSRSSRWQPSCHPSMMCLKYCYLYIPLWAEDVRGGDWGVQTPWGLLPFKL